MPPSEKKFVKYNFDDTSNKGREQRRPSRQSFKQRDNNLQSRGRRNVSYTEKSSSARQNVLKDMIATFIPVKKMSHKMNQLMKSFPKFFSDTPKQPQPFSPQSLNSYLTIMGKKLIDRQARTFAPIEHESESDPNWDSDSDVDGGIQSKKIDQNIVQKAKQKLNNIRQLRQDELKRHEKEFLQDYYRQKHQQQLQNEKQQQKKQPISTTSLQSKSSQSPLKAEQPDNEWTEYQQKQVNEFVNMGFIEKIQEDQGEFGSEDFSVEDDFSEGDEKSQGEKSQSSSSDEGDDDIFGDEGPTTIISKKEVVVGQNDSHKDQNLGKVVINSHLFTNIALKVGIPPAACIWIIRNKTQRYKVSTQFMDEMYRLNNFCESLPYVSLNHSQFVHNNDVQKEKGLQIFKKFNARKHQQSGGYGNQHHNKRNFDNSRKRFQQYKPNPQQQGTISSKTHINKK